MKYFLLATSVWIVTINALVHYEKLGPGKNGCKFKTGDIPVGGTAKDPNVCGVYVCQNVRGDALIHYCQQPASFQACRSDGVSTVTDFPQCCWQCVNYVDCSNPSNANSFPTKAQQQKETAGDYGFLQDQYPVDPEELAQYKALQARLC